VENTMSTTPHLFESLDLDAISRALEANPSSALLWIDTNDGRLLVFAITPWVGNVTPIQTSHLRSLMATTCAVMAWSQEENQVEILNIATFLDLNAAQG
jgi:hypothetical protein